MNSYSLLDDLKQTLVKQITANSVQLHQELFAWFWQWGWNHTSNNFDRKKPVQKMLYIALFSSTSHGRQSLLRISAQYFQTAILGPSIMHFCPGHCVHTGRLTPLLSQWLPTVHEKGSNYRKAVIQGTPETFLQFLYVVCGQWETYPQHPNYPRTSLDGPFLSSGSITWQMTVQAAALGQVSGISNKNTVTKADLSKPARQTPLASFDHLLQLSQCKKCGNVRGSLRVTWPRSGSGPVSNSDTLWLIMYDRPIYVCVYNQKNISHYTYLSIIGSKWSLLLSVSINTIVIITFTRNVGIDVLVNLCSHVYKMYLMIYQCTTYHTYYIYILYIYIIVYIYIIISWNTSIHTCMSL